MEEKKICKCCCSESGGGEGGLCPSDVRWRRESNQSLCSLVNTFRTIFEKDTNSLRIPSSPAELTQTRWIRKWRDQWRWLKNVKWAGLPPSFSDTCKSQQNVRKKSTLHCTAGRKHQSFSLPLNPLRYVERLWDLCCIGITEQKSIRFPRREETLSITVCPPVSESPLWFS